MKGRSVFVFLCLLAVMTTAVMPGASAEEPPLSYELAEGWEYLDLDSREIPPEDATGWVPIQVGQSFKSQGVGKPGGTGSWLRLRFDFPEHHSIQDPALYLGPVETFSKVWLNGVEISPPETSLDLPLRARLYAMPRESLLDEGNELLIRIHQLSVGGIYHEIPRIGEWRELAARKEDFERIPEIVDLADIIILALFLAGNLLLWLVAGKRVEFLLFGLADATLLPFLIIYSLPWVNAGLSGYFGGGLIVASWAFCAIELCKRLSGISLPSYWLKFWFILLIGAVMEFCFFMGLYSDRTIYMVAKGFHLAGLVPLILMTAVVVLRNYWLLPLKVHLIFAGFLTLLPLGLAGALGFLPVHPFLLEYLFLHGANMAMRVALLGAALLHIRDLEKDRIARVKGSVEALESEQMRLARELHDGIASATYGMKIKVQLLARRHPESQQLTDELVDDLGITARDVRHVSQNLRPALLESLGLSEALRSWAKPSEDSLDAPRVVIEKFPELPEPSPETALHLFRIVQEATANAIRHGYANNIHVSLTKSSSEICLSIDDDGEGIAAGREQSDGSGLKSMRDRASLMGGKLHIQNSRGESGTIISVTIPRWD